jgi:N utilization substance protein B
MTRKTARENAFILLFEAECKKDETAEEIFEKAIERELEVDEYVKKVFFGVSENKKFIDECIDKCLLKWKKERVSIVSRAILQLACYEMSFVEDIPTKVSINEAIELSKKFDDDKAYMFVNGVANAIAEELSKK